MIHTNAGPAEKWVPVTDEIFNSLYQNYCAWSTMSPFERAVDYAERAHVMALKRQENEVEALMAINPPEHHAWQLALVELSTVSSHIQDELGDRRLDGRPAFNDDQKARYDFAHAKALATYDAWDAICPTVPTVIWPPEIWSRLEPITKQIAYLKEIETAWRSCEKFTTDENKLWWHVHSGFARSPRFMDETEEVLAYLNNKLSIRYQQYREDKRNDLGLKPRLGLKLMGKKFKRHH